MHFEADSGAIKVLTVWISAAGIIAEMLISALAGLITRWFFVGSWVVGAVTVFAAIWYPPRYASALKVSFDGIAIRASIGVFRKQEIFVPIKALKTFELCSTPVQRLFKCGTVILRFAGGAAYLPLLPAAQAKDLTDALERY